MVNHPNRGRRPHPRYTLRGDYMTPDGLIRDLSPQTLEIIVVDGHAYDAYGHDNFQAPLSDLRIEIDEAGQLVGAGIFLPDEGEIDRVGRDLFPPIKRDA